MDFFVMERKAADAILAEWPVQVVASHALIVAQLLAGEMVEAELFAHLAGELLAMAKLARLLTRGANYINEARACWRETARTFEQCSQQWARLPGDGNGPVETHRRLLEQLRAQATEETELYTMSLCDRLRERH